MSVEWAKTFGFVTVIVAWAAPDNFQTLDAVRRFAGQLEALAGRLKPLGLKLGYHNHAHEMVKLGDDYALGRLYDLAPSLWGQTDIYWASNFGQVDTPAFVRRHAKRINSLHVKDGSFVPDQPMLAVGAGKVQTARCIQAADESVLRWLIVELDNCATDMLTAVRESYRFLVNNRLCVGKK
jgi:sugar phosphate isomerase/epimerase